LGNTCATCVSMRRIDTCVMGVQHCYGRVQYVCPTLLCASCVSNSAMGVGVSNTGVGVSTTRRGVSNTGVCCYLIPRGKGADQRRRSGPFDRCAPHRLETPVGHALLPFGFRRGPWGVSNTRLCVRSNRVGVSDTRDRRFGGQTRDIEADPSIVARRLGAPHRLQRLPNQRRVFSIKEQLLRRNAKLLRGGIVFKAHRLLYHSTLGWRAIKKKKIKE
jgi:hypothetical protein